MSTVRLTRNSLRASWWSEALKGKAQLKVCVCVCVCVCVKLYIHKIYHLTFPGGPSGKEPACQCRLDVRDASLVFGLGRSPGEGNGNPLQYSCLENSMDRGALRATVYAVTQSQTKLKQLTTHTQPFSSTQFNGMSTFMVKGFSIVKDVQAGFRKGRGTRDQIANIHWIIEKAKEFQKNSLLLLHWLH